MKQDHKPRINNPDSKFLVFADIDYDGFVIDIYDNSSAATIVKDKTWALGNPPSPFSLEDLVAIFNYMNYRSYKLTEENMFSNKSLSTKSNGFYTVGIVEINNNFTLEDYLTSRKSNL
jgi:hypothetical protein